MFTEYSRMDSPHLEAELRLALVPGVGPRIRQLLIECFGSAEKILQAPPSELRRVPKVGAKLSEAIAAATEAIDVQEELEVCRANDVRIMLERDADYPRLLREIADPPPLLFMRGELLPADELAIAVVGTRHATDYGVRQAEWLARDLARAGFTVVSGLARGIDAAAHRGALAAGGRTLAVLGGGVLNVYPPEHKQFAEQVVASGALISEAPPRRPALKGSFPQRNRIVSGLCLGVLVVEAAERSGALNSAKHATEQNRTVFAVPGRIDSRNSRGPHALIRDGARLVESVEDILSELGPLPQPTRNQQGQEIRHPAELKLDPQERAVLDAIHGEPTSIDSIVQATHLPVQRVLATLSVLEMRRLIRRLSGQQVARI